MYRTEPMHRADWFVLPVEAFTDDYSPNVGYPMYAHDLLYNHFQTEKYTGASRPVCVFLRCADADAEWWKLPGLPGRAVEPNEVLYVDKDRGAWIWDDTGRITFSASL